MYTWSVTMGTPWMRSNVVLYWLCLGCNVCFHTDVCRTDLQNYWHQNADKVNASCLAGLLVLYLKYLCETSFIYETNSSQNPALSVFPSSVVAQQCGGIFRRKSMAICMPDLLNVWMVYSFRSKKQTCVHSSTLLNRANITWYTIAKSERIAY